MEGYETQAGFWDKTAPRVMGDLIGRPSAVEMMGYLEGKRVLEAGCGTGYVARILAEKGARVSGCDISKEMLERAFKEEKGVSGIEYKLARITDTGYEDERFDGVISEGVLIHSHPAVLDFAYREARRILKPEGSFVVSVTHPCLFVPGSPSRSEEKNWVKHKLKDKSQEESKIFTEMYYDIEGNEFISEVWDYPMGLYINSARKYGFNIEEVREPRVEEKHLLHPSWGKEYGYPAFLQFRMVKK